MTEKLTLGQTVKLWSHFGPQTAIITKVGRVWCEATPTNSSQSIRIHMQDRTEGGQRGGGYRLYTLAEWSERERCREAQRFLRDQGIQLTRNSTWTAVALADVIRKAANLS